MQMKFYIRTVQCMLKNLLPIIVAWCKCTIMIAITWYSKAPLRKYFSIPKQNSLFNRKFTNH